MGVGCFELFNTKVITITQFKTSVLGRCLCHEVMNRLQMSGLKIVKTIQNIRNSKVANL